MKLRNNIIGLVCLALGAIGCATASPPSNVIAMLPTPFAQVIPSPPSCTADSGDGQIDAQRAQAGRAVFYLTLAMMEAKRLQDKTLAACIVPKRQKLIALQRQLDDARFKQGQSVRGVCQRVAQLQAQARQCRPASALERPGKPALELAAR
jgi:hypothetical protein